MIKIPTTLRLGNSLREMEEGDVLGVTSLYTQYMQRFDMAPVMSVDDVRHHLLSGNGTRQKEGNWFEEGKVRSYGHMWLR